MVKICWWAGQIDMGASTVQFRDGDCQLQFEHCKIIQTNLEKNLLNTLFVHRPAETAINVFAEIHPAGGGLTYAQGPHVTYEKFF